jgi:glycine/D-amino acid oxidase-like deaminating enzyme
VEPLKHYSSYSFWHATCQDDLTPRSPLPSDLDVDVAIVGAGYTGLWTAYYLSRADPSLRVAILEKEIAGFGASGRNGGWCSALFAASKEKLAARHGRDAAVSLQRELFRTVDEVGRVAAEEGIDAQFRKGGTLSVATAPAHVERLRAEVDDERAWGFGEDDYAWLTADEARTRIDVRSCFGAMFTPHCAAIHPARLVRGLAHAVERRGVSIFERTAALSIDEGVVETTRGRVKAEIVIRATEGYTPALPGQKRAVVPVYSLMIVTEPLSRATWDGIGWTNHETFNDGRHLLIYAQRTADDRIAFGGRGAPYHFASRVEDRFDKEPRVFADLHQVLGSLFPSAAGAAVTHRWGGPLGIPRDWFPSVGFDRERGMGWAGGYVGDGVGSSNLAGRTLADLVLGQETELTRLPWVGHRSRRWEPEPLRWLGVNFMLKTMAHADRSEARTGRPARWADRTKSALLGG